MNSIEQINRMSRAEMCELWRFAPADHPYFIKGTPENDAFEKKFTELGRFSSDISKQIGWDKP